FIYTPTMMSVPNGAPMSGRYDFETTEEEMDPADQFFPFSTNLFKQFVANKVPTPTSYISFGVAARFLHMHSSPKWAVENAERRKSVRGHELFELPNEKEIREGGGEKPKEVTLSIAVVDEAQPEEMEPQDLPAADTLSRALADSVSESSPSTTASAPPSHISAQRIKCDPPLSDLSWAQVFSDDDDEVEAVEEKLAVEEVDTEDDAEIWSQFAWSTPRRPRRAVLYYAPGLRTIYEDQEDMSPVVRDDIEYDDDDLLAPIDEMDEDEEDFMACDEEMRAFYTDDEDEETDQDEDKENLRIPTTSDDPPSPSSTVTSGVAGILTPSSSSTAMSRSSTAESNLSVPAQSFSGSNASSPTPTHNSLFTNLDEEEHSGLEEGHSTLVVQRQGKSQQITKALSPDEEEEGSLSSEDSNSSLIHHMSQSMGLRNRWSWLSWSRK
ncbi:hypothetical protein P7C73_g3494, partial [Tremellales sp. Uapishka_1]